MTCTYKLDKYGLPYRVKKQRHEKKENSGLFSGLLAHKGKQENFHLYVFQA